MGFWQTGYMEFHEPISLESSYVPTPPVYICKHCEETFSSADALRIHRFESHTFPKPTMFLRNKEIGTSPLRITKPLVKGDIHVSHCDHAWLNGVSINPFDIEDELVVKATDVVTVKLANEGVFSEFSLQFEIASEEDVEGVTGCFFNMARKGHLGMHTVEDFIEAAQEFSTASTYLDGICHYLYGVLAKERSLDSSLPYETYREKFTLAENSLKDFDHPLVRVIVAIINFHFNCFRESVDLASESRVGIASGRFERWMAGDIEGANRLLSRTFDTRMEKLLTDSETERLIKWCVSDVKTMVPQMCDALSLIRNKNITEFDRTKLHVLLAELYADLGEAEKVRNHARELRNNPTFGLWAESALERLTNGEQSYV